MSSITYTCPCCGFVVFSTPTGGYELCPVCNWEDDNVQLRYPGMTGGANGPSLQEAQQALLAKIPAGIPIKDGFVKDARWRPLNEDEIINFEPERAEVRNTGDALPTGEGERGWVVVVEDPFNTFDYYWLRHN